MTSTRILTLMALIAFAAAPSTASAQAPVPDDLCTALIAGKPARTLSAPFGPGRELVVVDRYGGELPRLRHGASQFVLRVRRGGLLLSVDASRALLASTRTTLDGKATRNPFYVQRQTLGRHVFAFDVQGKDGTSGRLEVPYATTDCSGARAAYGSGGLGTYFIAGSGENGRGGNPELRRVEFARVALRDIRTRRGKEVGRLALSRQGSPFPALLLRVPRATRQGASSIVLARRGALSVSVRAGRLVVAGIPADVTTVDLSLPGGFVRQASAGRPIRATLTDRTGGRLTVTAR